VYATEGYDAANGIRQGYPGRQHDGRDDNTFLATVSFDGVAKPVKFRRR